MGDPEGRAVDARPTGQSKESGARPLGTDPQPPATWPGTARYGVLRELGRGGMGVVYEALDRERLEPVALKTLLAFDPSALYRFKQEFRALTDVVHPNLVHLHELVVSDTDGTFFTMELVNGVDFVSYVRAHGLPDARDASGDKTAIDRHPSSQDEGLPGPQPRPTDTCFADLEKLRPALRGLVEGVHALHLAGRVHRDLKPSNILVTAAGRVVILDLGVATSLRPAKTGGGITDTPELAGTAKYMAPEQASGDTPAPAADWYSVGVILYETLLGRAPFVGAVMDILERKALVDAVPPSHCADGVPPDLDRLCVDLLQRDPERRPGGLDVLRRVNERRSSRPIPSLIPRADPMRPATLIGRDELLAALRAAFDRVTAGCAVTVRLGGEPGAGKSALAAHFVDGLAERGEAVVLRGRVYERESLPYKAVDGVVDELTRVLVKTAEEGEPLELPVGVGALARVFAVLRQVPNVVEDDEAVEPHALRRRAFDALRDLLASVAKRWPLVIYIDDVQWGDADSAALLLSLMRPPDAPPLLLVLTYRAGEKAESVFLKDLSDGWPGDAEERELTVGALSAEDAQALALSFLEPTHPMAERTARAVARESRGNPFLIQELAQSNQASGEWAEGATLTGGTIEVMIGQHLKRLPDASRGLIEMIAVGGRPLPASLLAEASETGGGLEEALAPLRALRFARTSWRDGGEVVEAGHDRYRETIVAQLAPEVLRACNRRLAQALEADPHADAEAIALYWVGAGENGRAAQHAERAAAQAEGKLAFDHAARLYRLTLEARRATGSEARRLLVRQAAALEAAGRASLAADVYREAAQGASGRERIEIERAAGENLLMCGRIDEGSTALRNVLAEVGMRAPRTTFGALFWLIVYRIGLSLLGLRVRQRAPEDVLPKDRLQLDALFAFQIGMNHVDFILGASMGVRFTLLALRKGDALHVLHGLVLEFGRAAATGESDRTPSAVAAMAQTVQLASAAGPQGETFWQRELGIAHYLRGRFASAIAAFDMARSTHRTPADLGARLHAVWALFFTGRLRDEGIQARRLLRASEDRGDLVTSVSLRVSSMADMSLVADDPNGARRSVVEAMALWTQHGFHLQHWLALFWEARIDHYVGAPEKAWQRLERHEAPLKRSLLLEILNVRVLSGYMGGCCAVGAAAMGREGKRRRALLAEARRRARRLDRELEDATAPTYATILDASVACIEGRHGIAKARLENAVRLADAADLKLHAAAARYQLGRLLGGDSGRALLTEGERWMRSEGIRAPERWAEVLVPGRWKSDAAAQ